jgi:hypothetical protein
MNEYEVTVSVDGAERKLIVEAATAAGARDQTENRTETEVLKVQFLRATGFSCRIRGGN